jgi:O-6-methylguanine DNA methyltransferase
MVVDCNELEKLLDAYRTNELVQKDHLRVERHLHRCSRCRQQLEWLTLLAKQMPALRVRGQAHPPSSQAVTDWYSPVRTAIGTVWVACSLRGISLVSLGRGDSEEFEVHFQQRLRRRARSGSIPRDYAEAVRRAAAGIKPAEVPLDLSSLSPFERSILLNLKQIPLGEVRPYNWLARESGRPKAVRAVGNAMARNPIPFLLPCHRVVPASGGVGNYGYGSALKRALLEREGVPVDELDACAREGFRFVGCKRTNIYCYPACSFARRMLPKNRIPFHSAEEALQAGFRSCRHCRPV